jgi:flagellar basal body-associated protein FliL
MSDETPTPSETPAPPAKRGRGWLVITLAIVLVAGGGAGWWLLSGTPAEADEPSIEERGMLTFEPFLVNLADTGGNRFFKVNVQLVLPSAEGAEHLQKTPVVLMHLRSAILELLTQQTSAALVTPQGKAALRDAIKEKTSGLIDKQKVIDVLFSEFVVQF